MNKKKITFVNSELLTEEQLCSEELFLRTYSDDTDLVNPCKSLASCGQGDKKNLFGIRTEDLDSDYKFYYQYGILEEIGRLNINLDKKYEPMELDDDELDSLDEDDEDDLDLLGEDGEEDEDDEELGEALNLLIDLYRTLMPKEVYLVKNKPRYDRAVKSIKEFSRLILKGNSDTVIEVKPDSLTGSSLLLEVTTNMIVFEDMPELINVLAATDNLDICTLTDGRISLGAVYSETFSPAEPFLA